MKLEKLGASQKAGIGVVACFLAMALSLDLTYVEPRENLVGATETCMQLLDALPSSGGEITLVLLACGIGLLLYCFVLAVRRRSMRGENSIFASAIAQAVFFAFAMVFGSAYSEANTAAFLFDGGTQIVKTTASFIAWGVVAYVAVSLLFAKLDERDADKLDERDSAELDERDTNERDGAPAARCRVAPAGAHRATVSSENRERNNRERKTRKQPTPIAWLMDTHPFMGPAIVLAVAWAPTFIGFAPALFMGDTFEQINMWFNLPNYPSSLLNLIDPDIQLCQHHPVLHTALLGLCVQAGLLAGSATLGMALYASIQYVLSILAISYALAYLRKRGVIRGVRVFILAFMAFVPLFSGYAVLATKDTLFAASLLVFVVQVAKTINRESGRADWIALVVSGVLVGLMRNGGVLYSVAGIVACIPAARREWKALAASALTVALVCVSASNIVMPSLGITPGSQREILSVPFQQTARYVTEHPADVTPEQRESIDAVLGYDDLPQRYDPNKSDHVKDGFNKDATDEQMRSYWRTWAQQGASDPLCYLEATANNYYEYFYPADTPSLYGKAWSAKCMKELGGGLSVHHLGNPLSTALGEAVTISQLVFAQTPFLSLAMSSCFYVWILLLFVAYCLHARRWRGLVLVCPLVLVFLTCLIGPCNGSYTRYILPVAFALPFVVALCLFANSALDRVAHAPEVAAKMRLRDKKGPKRGAGTPPSAAFPAFCLVSRALQKERGSAASHNRNFQPE